MTSALAELSPARRRRAARGTALIAVVLLAVGLLALLGTTPLALRLVGGIGAGIGALFALIAWGFLASARTDQREAELDGHLLDATGHTCDCGHDHDPDELTVHAGVENPCATTGDACTGVCDGCALSALKR